MATRSDILGEARWELKRVQGPILKGLAALFTVAMLLGMAAVGVMWWVSGKAQPPTSAIDSRIPLNSYTAAVVQVMDCIDKGPQVCPEFQRSKDYLILSSGGEGIIYTPLTATDPGEALPDGTRKIVFTKTTPEADWKAFARAGTYDGVATPLSVTEKTVVPKEATGTFTLNGGKVTGVMTFSLNQNTMSLRKIVYTKEK
jgi:hypothetical protein